MVLTSDEEAVDHTDKSEASGNIQLAISREEEARYSEDNNEIVMIPEQKAIGANNKTVVNEKELGAHNANVQAIGEL